MGRAAIATHYIPTDHQDEVKMLGHDNVGIHRHHRIVGGDGGQQLALNSCADRCELHADRAVLAAFHRAQRLPHPLRHMQGDVVDAGARVVVGCRTPGHAVLYGLLHIHFTIRIVSCCSRYRHLGCG
ncbi:MAG: hypothetical protein IKP36_11715 [Bacteroidaceae bacterium]|nr:hypothetical protein [Bacteroidaceae bacterium]